MAVRQRLLGSLSCELAQKVGTGVMGGSSVLRISMKVQFLDELSITMRVFPLSSRPNVIAQSASAGFARTRTHSALLVASVLKRWRLQIARLKL